MIMGKSQLAVQSLFPITNVLKITNTQTLILRLAFYVVFGIFTPNHHGREETHRLRKVGEENVCLFET